MSPAGWLVIVLALLGFVLPFFLERRLAVLPFSPGTFFQGLMILGLCFHQTLDGMAAEVFLQVGGIMKTGTNLYVGHHIGQSNHDILLAG